MCIRDRCRTILQDMYADSPETAARMAAMGETQLAAALDAYLQNPDEDVLLSIYDTYISSGSYDENMSAFGVVSLDAPSSISLYADSFEDKDAISACIETYNSGVEEENQITYTDYVGLLMSSVTTIVNVISYVLIEMCIRDRSSYWGFLLMGVHLGLHWGMMMGLARRAAGIRKPSTVRTWLMRAAAALLAAYGLYAFINNDIASYMLLRTQFVFFDMEQPLSLIHICPIQCRTLKAAYNTVCRSIWQTGPSCGSTAARKGLQSPV